MPDIDVDIKINLNSDKLSQEDLDAITVEHNLKDIVKQVYNLGYQYGLRHQQNTPHFP